MIISASLEHLDAVCKLEQQFGAEAYTKVSLRRFILTNKLKIFVDGFGNLIGSAIVINRKNSNTSTLYSFIIDEKFRGLGVGKVYLQVLLEQVQTKYIKLQVSESNIPAIKLYKGSGFTIVGYIPNYYTDNSSALVMKKLLT